MPKRIAASANTFGYVVYNLYKLAHIFWEMLQLTLHQLLKREFLKTDCFRKTISSKVDLIWQLWPIRLRRNDRIFIFVLSCLHPNLEF